MVVKKRRKFRRKRGSRECGYGVFHRGKGCKGGAGKAGTGKRAKAKMPQKGKWTCQYQGKHGFKYHGRSIVKVPINIKTIEDKLDSWIKTKKVIKENDFFIVNLSKLGFNKLLSTGKVSKKLKVSVMFASKAAVEKIKVAGGEVILPKEKVKPK